jgi:MSHA biogenesis protein MshE
MNAQSVTKTSLGATLLAQGLLQADQIETALEEQRRSGRPFGRILIEKGFASEVQVARALAEQHHLPYIDLQRHDLNPGLVSKFTEAQSRRFNAIVLEDRGQAYLVGVVDPNDLRTVDRMTSLLRRPLDLAVVESSQLLKAIEHCYRKTEQIDTFAREVEREVEGQSTTFDLRMIEQGISETDAPVVKLLRTIFDEAAQTDVSDIHIEPQEETLVVRFRVDGVLHVQLEADARIGPPLMVRLKLIANLDISEKRLPQDGRISILSGTSKFDIRMATMPTQFGESAVLRLLRQDSVHQPLDEILPAHVLPTFMRAIRASHGIVLVTGPTGSGKTTSLYAAIEALNRRSVKIMTCEDPIEYRIPGIMQIQVNDQIGLTFARVLRTSLRQDPDILLVGEIRDEETADIAIRAAMTGHLVLSTLHTNDARSAPTRLINMGVPGYLIASTLLAVVSQRLVRVICKHCSEPHTPGADERAWLKYYASEAALARAQLQRGHGCAHCHGLGFSGRVGVFEIIEMNDQLIDALHRSDHLEFDRAARAQVGAQTLEAEAIRLVLDGRTTVAEAMTVMVHGDFKGDKIRPVRDTPAADGDV